MSDNFSGSNPNRVVKGVPETVVPKMVGFFMNRFRTLGFIHYNGGLGLT
jgi:hypothetical protein